MPILFSNPRPPRGTALIVTMVVMILLAALATTLLLELSTRADRTEADLEDIKSFEAAEAGLDAAIKSLNNGGNGCLGIGWWVTTRATEEASKVADLNSDGWPQANEVTGGGWHRDIIQVNGADEGDGMVCPRTGYVAPPGMPKADRMAWTDGGGTAHDDPMPRPQPQEFDFYSLSMQFGDARYFTFAVPWGNDGIDNDFDGFTDGHAQEKENGLDEKDWYTIYSTGFSSDYSMRLSTNPTNPLGKFTTVEAIVKKLTSTLMLDAALEIQIAPYAP